MSSTDSPFTTLLLVDAAEKGASEDLAPLLAEMPLAASEFNSLNLEAHRWMLGVIRESQGGASA